MGKIYYLLLLLFLLGSCSRKVVNSDGSSVRGSSSLVGNDREEHGCLGSAGEVWCSLLDSCIRPFDTGIRLIDKGKGGYVKAAYAVFNKDSSKVQLFIPDVEEEIILDKVTGESGTLWFDKSNKIKYSLEGSNDHFFIAKKSIEVYRQKE